LMAEDIAIQYIARHRYCNKYMGKLLKWYQFRNKLQKWYQNGTNSEINYKYGTNPTHFSTLPWYWYYFCNLFAKWYHLSKFP
jgi:hypothetical protein